MSAAAAEHSNVVAYRRMIEGFNSNDLSAVAELVDENVAYTIPGRSLIACQTTGLAAHLSALRRARELSDGTLKLEPRAIAADGDYLVVWGRISAQRQGRALDCEHCVMYRFRSGKIVEGRTVPIDLYAFDAFWS
ncbi:MAG: nuclear transport factor 2 family protein [Myxococcales bacterium]|nr:MAG: nuclear transport factor 2 family protein [Myxococcales bacterium]